MNGVVVPASFNKTTMIQIDRETPAPSTGQQLKLVGGRADGVSFRRRSEESLPLKVGAFRRADGTTLIVADRSMPPDPRCILDAEPLGPYHIVGHVDDVACYHPD